MYLCYVDESGTPDIPGNTSHYVLAGLSIPVWHWRDAEAQIYTIKQRYSLQDGEIHSGWLTRKYIEQNKIPNFSRLDYSQRRYEVERYRKTDLLNLQKSHKHNLYKQTKKNYKHTENYIHLTYGERISFLEEIARIIGNWGFARLFAECVDKIHFDPKRIKQSVDEQAFEQIVSRFEQFLKSINTFGEQNTYGLLVHDNNETVAKKHTDLMKTFHTKGTLFTQVNYLIETPLFVSSELTSMVQLADVCAYALRRYLENKEERLFDHIFKRADRKGDVVVGVRHFTNSSCSCKICTSHRIK
ncbi:MAG: DUF3800 domain-containing protein [Deltaproteobacteria bacterium]|nr:DUF3800 domain-containing protein [Deltaproteobacteria bacterium]